MMYIRASFLIIGAIIVGTDMQFCYSVLFVDMVSDLCVKECCIKELCRYDGSCNKRIWTNNKFVE
jgi:hypothetical protein